MSLWACNDCRELYGPNIYNCPKCGKQLEYATVGAPTFYEEGTTKPMDEYTFKETKMTAETIEDIINALDEIDPPLSAGQFNSVLTAIQNSYRIGKKDINSTLKDCLETAIQWWGGFCQQDEMILEHHDDIDECDCCLAKNIFEDAEKLLKNI